MDERYEYQTDDSDSNEYALGTMAFLAGALIGAGVALLLAPQSGDKTRDMLRDYVGKAKDDVMERGRQAKSTLDKAVDRGKAAYESGRESMRGAREPMMRNRDR